MIEPTVAYLSGTNWDGPVSTDRQLAEELAHFCPVVWIDPPVAVHRWTPRSAAAAGLPASLERYRSWAPPFLTKPGVRGLTRLLYHGSIKHEFKGRPIAAQILSGPLQTFPSLPGRRILFATDDWVAGSNLMGLDDSYVSATLKANASRCDILAGVSRHLVERIGLMTTSKPERLVIPNAVSASRYEDPRPRPRYVPERPYAVLVGQINERIDLRLIRDLAARDVPVVIAGALRARSESYTLEFSALCREPSVTHVGLLPTNELVALLQHSHVGLTPYVLTEFNRASSPLKTWDYLAAGIPVVSTDIPASREVATPEIEVAADNDHFIELVINRLSVNGYDSRRARAVTKANSWTDRARQLLDVIFR